MPKKSKKPTFNFHQPRFTQISESHCGPAVVQMLLGNLGIEVSQEDVAEYGGATDLIELNGMRVDQLALAVRKLAPQILFWYKDRAKLKELAKLVAKYRIPVGVEWQGVFEDEDENGANGEDSETEDTDYGHYSVVSYVNRKKKELIIVDPYKDFIAQDRIFSFDQFKKRWWDFNEITDLETGETRLVEDYHMMFIVTGKEEEYPLLLGMKKA